MSDGASGSRFMDVPLTVVSAPTESLDEQTRAEIVRVCVVAHAEPDFENLFRYIPSGGRHFLAYAGEALAGHAVVTSRWCWVSGDRRLRTAYVDAVATLPAFQGQGYGTAVMRRLAGAIGDFDIACLETDRPSFYTRLGWELWRGPLAGIQGSEVTPTPDQRGVMILRLAQTPALDLDGPLTIECQNGRIW